MEIRKHGKTWILDGREHKCPDCGQEDDDSNIIWNVRAERIRMNNGLYEIHTWHILENKCLICGCEWITKRKEEE